MTFLLFMMLLGALVFAPSVSPFACVMFAALALTRSNRTPSSTEKPS